MDMRHGSIRRAGLRRPSDVVLKGASALFWLLLVLAMVSGGARVAAGLPVVAAGLFPQGLIAAEAKSDEPTATAAIAVRGPVYPSPYAPRVLAAAPAVMADAMPPGAALRGQETSGDNGGAPAPPPMHGAVIALVIDDLGADVTATRHAMRLPAAVTLSFLPYPDATPELARAATAGGHQILVHVPMQPEGRDDPGPNALLTGLGPDELRRRLAWALGRVPGFSGINNHMGSRFTADRTALLPVVEMLADRHVFFLDSRTTPDSQVVPLAHAFGVASAGRDVFLDDEQRASAVEAQLALTETVARDTGVAIAIGHPHAVTLAALDAWTAHLSGFTLVPVSVAIRLKAEREALALRQ